MSNYIISDFGEIQNDKRLKNFFNRQVVEKFSDRLKLSWNDFDKDGFCNDFILNFELLELKERSNLICDLLVKYLPKNFVDAVEILLCSLRINEDSRGSFIVMPQTTFISRCGKGYFDISMNALYEMTKYFTSEHDLQTFIEIDFDKTMNILHEWCQDEDENVRRLVSEGTRSRIPWGARIKRFQKDPFPVIELLDKLKNDTSIYVGRSVANNINDIFKDNPDIAIKTLQRWKKEGACDWVIKHAARNMIKQGYKEAMELFDFTLNPKIEVSNFIVDPKKINIGDKINFVFDILAKEFVLLSIDYLIHYVKFNGVTKHKVFKIKTLELDINQAVKIEKNIHIRQATTRKIYPGLHKIEIQINGIIFAGVEFDIK